MINLTPASHIEQQLFWYGYYEKPVALLLAKIVKVNDIVLDVGANIGYFSLIASKNATAGKVFAFEPVRFLFEKLNQNIELNKAKNIESVCAAVGDRQKKAVIYISDRDNPGMSSLEPAENFSGSSSNITMISIDDWMRESKLEKLDIVKMDIEGSELLALHGMRLALLSYKPFLIIEINDETLSRFAGKPNDIYQFMQQLGYTPFEITVKGNLKEKNRSLPEENVAFIHKDKIEQYRFCFIKN